MRRGPFYSVLMPHRFGLEHYHSDSVAVYFYVLSALSLLFHQLHAPDTTVAWAGTIASVVFLIVTGVLAKPLRPWMTQVHVWIAAIGFVFYQILALTSFIEGDMLATTLREVIALLFLYCLVLSMLTLRSLRDGTIELEEIARQDSIIASGRMRSPSEVFQSRQVKERLQAARRAGKSLS